jgi:uncharacterized protein YjbJ (UPF0337 family)
VVPSDTGTGDEMTDDATKGKRTDEAKGRMKEAAGSLADDEELRREGKGDQAKSSIKDAVDKVKDALTPDDE